MKNIFGTDGIRDKVHHGALTTENLAQLGHAIGQWATNNFEKPVRILMGSDTRSSCPSILQTLSKSLLQYPVELFNGHVIPTPVVCKLVREEDFDLGIIISASHNSAEYNGIKIVKKYAKISAFSEGAITQLYHHEKFINHIPIHAVQEYDQASQLYEIFITAWFEPNFLQNKKIVLDCAQGATYKLAPKIFEHFNANVIVINNLAWLFGSRTGSGYTISRYNWSNYSNGTKSNYGTDFCIGRWCCHSDRSLWWTKFKVTSTTNDFCTSTSTNSK